MPSAAVPFTLSTHTGCVGSHADGAVQPLIVVARTRPEIGDDPRSLL